MSDFSTAASPPAGRSKRGAPSADRTATILVGGSSVESCATAAALLEPSGFRIVTAAGKAALFETLESNHVDLTVLDEGPDDDVIELLDRLRRERSGIPVIVLAARATIDRAVSIIKHGACHYLARPVERATLERQVSQCLAECIGRIDEIRPMVRDRGPASNAPSPSRSRIIARSGVMQALLGKISQVAATDANVYIEGESGTGKELVARCLHGESRRASGPFVAINCAALPENLLESELLGYEKGAFTGADSRRVGLFAQADGGSFFFDEVAELPLSMQAKLLRILEEREFYPLGGTRKVSVDVRIIAAANRDLEQRMHDGQFREDLYYRIRVIPIRLPPLRERREDIMPLARHFLERFNTATGKAVTNIDGAAEELLMAADWPGNVRELENVIEYAVALAGGDAVTPELLKDVLPGYVPEEPPLREAKDAFEKQYLEQLLQRHRGNVSKAAKEAGKHRADLYAALRRHDLEAASFRR